jgi:acyl carrier protein
MLSRDQIRETVLLAIDRVKELSMDERGLTSDESAVLLGEWGALDSMGFVNFVVALEEEMSRISEQPLDLVEVLNSPEVRLAPISTVGQLIDFLYYLNAV